MPLRKQVPLFYQILVNLALWITLPLLVFIFRRNFLSVWLRGSSGALVFLMPSIVIQMLLSGSLERIVHSAKVPFAHVAALSVNV
jgi:hypothetical protein